MDEHLFDLMIVLAANKYRMPWLLIWAQISAESSFNRKAVSPCGAVGLMQLMPETAKEQARGTRIEERGVDLFNPEINIELGVKYDRWLYEHLPEICSNPDPNIPAPKQGQSTPQAAPAPLDEERLKFVLAAYNCGLGHVNQALRLAREEEFGYQPLATIRGKWQTWKYSCRQLASPLCFIETAGTGKEGGSRTEDRGTRKRIHPDYMAVWSYVERVWGGYQQESRASRNEEKSQTD